MANLLVVDDEQSICWGLRKLGESLGHRVKTASSAEAALELAAEHPFDLVVLDVRLPGVDGLSAMAELSHLTDQAPIIVITAFGDLPTAVEAVDKGAFEYVLKPFDLADIRAAVLRALAAGTEVRSASPPAALEGMLGLSPVMQEVFKKIALAARSEAAVLLQGESGTGKELAARAIHRYSPRRDKPFVAVNIAALNPAFAESELFGHVEGAFSGAGHARRGLLVEANGGTLLLDEVAEIPLPLQTKLLRVLDSGEVLPLGADQPVETHLRVVAATHHNLRSRVEAGLFRHDLYFRLSAFRIDLPPLRERTGDVALIAEHLVSQLGSPSSQLTDGTLAELASRPWHGNVRELRNAIEHALVIAPTGPLLPEHLPPPEPPLSLPVAATPTLTDLATQRATELLSDPQATGHVYERFLEEVERPLLTRTMQEHDHQYAPAARALGLHRTTLKKKLEDYGIPEGEG